MTGARALTIGLLCGVLGTSVLCAGDLSRYRKFQLGMNLPAVVKLVGMNPSEARVIHQRPELIQELDWQPGRYPGSSPRCGPVKSILFSLGFNAQSGEYEDLVKAGVLDPTKVVRLAVQNASSIAALMLTTEALVCDTPEKKKEAAASGPGGHDMYD